MKFIHRFAYYLIGITIGSIFVYFIWEKKNVQFDYLPNARVLKDIRNDTQKYSSDALEQMQTLQLDSVDIAQILEFGDIDFGESKPREKPCKTYVIYGSPKEKEITLVVKKCDSVSTFESIKQTIK